MNFRRKVLLSFGRSTAMGLAILVISASAFAEDKALEAAPAEAATEEKKLVGINVDVESATIYNFRGLNMFAETAQMEQHAMFAPSLTWSIFETGLSLGYWGAYQLSGENRTEKVASGYGHEQDLILGYSLGFIDDLILLDFAFTYIFYPFAAEASAGTKNPSYIEPLAGITVATVLDLSFAVSYFHGIQEEIKSARHVYFNLSAGKSFTFNDIFGMDLGMGLGIKAWIEDVNENRFDLHFDWGVPIHLTDRLYVEPALHFVWTDLETVAMEDDPATPEIETERDAEAGDEYMIYASINVGANF